jgi:phosphoribosylformylglycinamidine cyclo-ligase
MALMKLVTIKGLAHITGGGITENIPRILGKELHAEIDVNSWQQPAVFDWLQSTGQIATDEMRRTFNCGVGMAVVVAAADEASAIETLSRSGENAWRLGEIKAGASAVAYR